MHENNKSLLILSLLYSTIWTKPLSQQRGVHVFTHMHANSSNIQTVEYKQNRRIYVTLAVLVHALIEFMQLAWDDR